MSLKSKSSKCWSNSKTKSRLDLNQFSSSINRRIKALKKLEFEKLEIQRQLNRDVFALQVKYELKYKPLLNKRSKIISGKHEPNDEECDFTLDEDQGEGQLSENLRDKLVLKALRSGEPEKGIPGFWLLAMKSSEVAYDWIYAHDEPVLMYLMDIRVQSSINPFKLYMEFIFTKNPYFTNEVLTKEYVIEFRRNTKKSWDLGDFLVVDCKGCQIDWNDGKNVRLIKKEVPKKGNKKRRKKFEDSFFEFFDPPVISPKYENMDDDTYDRLKIDWSLGRELIQSVVPDAMLHLTGAFDDDSDYSEEDSSESASD